MAAGDIVPPSCVHHIVTLLNPKRNIWLLGSGASFRLASDLAAEDASDHERVPHHGWNVMRLLCEACQTATTSSFSGTDFILPTVPAEGKQIAGDNPSDPLLVIFPLGNLLYLQFRRPWGRIGAGLHISSPIDLKGLLGEYHAPIHC